MYVVLQYVLSGGVTNGTLLVTYQHVAQWLGHCVYAPHVCVIDVCCLPVWFGRWCDHWYMMSDLPSCYNLNWAWCACTTCVSYWGIWLWQYVLIGDMATDTCWVACLMLQIGLGHYVHEPLCVCWWWLYCVSARWLVLWPMLHYEWPANRVHSVLGMMCMSLMYYVRMSVVWQYVASGDVTNCAWCVTCHHVAKLHGHVVYEPHVFVIDVFIVTVRVEWWCGQLHMRNDLPSCCTWIWAWCVWKHMCVTDSCSVSVCVMWCCGQWYMSGLPTWCKVDLALCVWTPCGVECCRSCASTFWVAMWPIVHDEWPVIMLQSGLRMVCMNPMCDLMMYVIWQCVLIDAVGTGAWWVTCHHVATWHGHGVVAPHVIYICVCCCSTCAYVMWPMVHYEWPANMWHSGLGMVRMHPMCLLLMYVLCQCVWQCDVTHWYMMIGMPSCCTVVWVWCVCTPLVIYWVIDCDGACWVVIWPMVHDEWFTNMLHSEFGHGVYEPHVLVIDM